MTSRHEWGGGLKKERTTGSARVPLPGRSGIDPATPDVAAYPRQAGLLEGERAVVILRIQVQPDGRAGPVLVDASIGSAQVDEAAAAYARQLAWVPGRWHDIAEAIWVRYSVHLVA